ncbi:tyrosine-type recombinase/integrase, partial [Candidatus Palauibacter sp.]|uniref:tyrosine-type recombinase/integrase n=1 Tax=Candidatus Palauibacter sp. TaxID=3101350 RepID=UPI003B5BC1C3
MARTKRGRRSYGAGEWGRNRVRIFPDPKTDIFQIEWRENGRRLTRSLKHRDWARAKSQADQFAAGFIDAPNGKAEAEPEPLTLERLFDIYGEEVTPTKRRPSRARDRVAMAMFLKFFGRDRRPETLSQRDWDRFIRERRAGTVGPSGKPVGNRMIEWDLTFLMAVLNWAARSRDEEGRLLLDRNPLKGLRKPIEKNPTRVVLTEEEYQALLQVSRQVDWRFHVALVLAHETGHRIGAIRNLRWADIDLEGETVRWRAEHEKTGYEHRTPLTPEANRSLRSRSRGGEAQPGLRGRAGAARDHESLGVPGLPASPLLVEAGGAARGTRTEARKGLALAETEVCQRPDGPAAQGALRTRRLEGGQDRAALLPAARRGATQAGNPEPPQAAAGLNPIGGNRLAGIAPAESITSTLTTVSAPDGECWPIFDILPSLGLPPVLCCRG